MGKHKETMQAGKGTMAIGKTMEYLQWNSQTSGMKGSGSPYIEVFHDIKRIKREDKGGETK
jgi:hypothetical protein